LRVRVQQVGRQKFGDDDPAIASDDNEDRLQRLASVEDDQSGGQDFVETRAVRVSPVFFATLEHSRVISGFDLIVANRLELLYLLTLIGDVLSGVPTTIQMSYDDQTGSREPQTGGLFRQCLNIPSSHLSLPQLC
jgi:hypothetical protein